MKNIQTILSGDEVGTLMVNLNLDDSERDWKVASIKSVELFLFDKVSIDITHTVVGFEELRTVLEARLMMDYTYKSLMSYKITA